jgi:hypothetical protein
LSFLKVLSAILLCGLQDRVPYEGTLNGASVLARIDVTCILRTWRIKGVLWCPWKSHWKPCLWVENAYPCGLLEVVRQSFRSHLAELPLPAPRRTTSGHKEAELQFAESRVLTYVPSISDNLEIPIAAPRGPQYRINYVSELDFVGWRTGLLDLLFARTGECAGSWGCYEPRMGFVQQPSEPLAAHLQALRGGRVAARPVGRIVLAPYEFEPRTGHYLQMVSPVVKPCVSIGHPDLRGLETASGSPYGAYLFVHWGYFEACKRCLPTRFLPPRPPGP